MDISTGDVITLAAIVFAGGGAFVTIASLKERVSRLERGGKSQGERLGDGDKRLALLEDWRDRTDPAPRRRLTRPVEFADEPSGGDER